MQLGLTRILKFDLAVGIEYIFGQFGKSKQD
jgi:hypothetical protein